MEKLSLSLLVGAAFSASFNTVIGSAPRKLASIGTALDAVNKSGRKLEAFQNAERDLELARGGLAAVQRELLQVKKAMQGASGEELQKLTRQAENLAEKAARLSVRVETTRDKVSAARLAHQQAASAVGQHTAALGKLGSSIESLRTRQEKLTAAMSHYQAAQAKTASARGSLFDAVAIGAGLKAAFSGAGALQSKLTDIAITADIPREKIAAIGQSLGKLAATTGQTREALAGGLQVLVASGLDADRAMASIEAIGKTATASGAEVEDVSKTVFSLLDNLKVAPGDAIRAMDMLVAAGKAGRFELKDMAKYFPGMTADAAKLGLTGTAAVSALGASLQIALKGAADPADAANNMKNYLAKLTAPETVKHFQKFGVNLEKEFKSWTEKGLNPIEESLRLIQKLTNGDSFKIGELFGDMQVKSFITPMLQQADEYRRIKAEVDAASGSVEIDLARRMKEDPTQAWRRMGESLSQLRDAAIVPLLPKLGELIDTLSAGAITVSSFMQRNETLVSVLGTTLSLMLGGKVAFSALAWGLGLVRVAWTGLTLAFAVNPIGAALAALAFAGTVIYANWDKLGPLFDAVTTKMMAVGGAVIDGLVRGITAGYEALKAVVFRAADSVAGWFKEKLGIRSPSRVFIGFGQMISEGAALGIANGAPGLVRATGALAASAVIGVAPALAGSATLDANQAISAPAAASQVITNHITIQISQNPGENGEALAQRVADLIKAQAGQTRRAALGDW